MIKGLCTFTVAHEVQLKTMARKSPIPIHKIVNNDLGFELRNKAEDTGVYDADYSPLITHRDDFYVFFLQQSGVLEFMRDFEQVKLEGMNVSYMCPGQVHQYFKIDATGWILGIETALIPPQLRQLLESGKNQRQTGAIIDCTPLLNCIELITTQRDSKSDYGIRKAIIHSLLEALIGMMAQAIFQSAANNHKLANRKIEITDQLRELVQQNLVSLKTPGEYAGLLNISVAYLNESVKENTGFSASHLIQEEIFLEAKRLLHHTRLNAREIAFRLGYQDPTYFSRLFRKFTGYTPLAFRANQLL